MLTKARIFHADPAKVDKRILRQLIDLTRVPGQNGFILRNEIVNNAPNTSFDVRAYDSERQLLSVIIRSREGYARWVDLEIPID